MQGDGKHLAGNDIAVGIDLGAQHHHVVVLDVTGKRLTSFRIAHAIKDLGEMLRRCSPARLGRRGGRAVFAFEATGHLWEGVAHFLATRNVPYRLVNPLATHRLREARQMGRDKRDVTDAEQVAHLLRTGMVTKTQLWPEFYVALRRGWYEYARLREARARLKTLAKHQRHGVFPELVGVWKDLFGPGGLAVLRLSLTPQENAALSYPRFLDLVRSQRRGRRLWTFKVRHVHERARTSIGSPLGASAAMRELRRLVERVDALQEQLEEVGKELREMLDGLEEARYLATMPGIGWATVAGLIAEIGPVERYRHGRQLIKLAGINPSRRESGLLVGRTTMTRRGRAGLRSLVYMATLASLVHNLRLRAHYERLLQRQERPLKKMQAFGACMTKFLLQAFAVMEKRQTFDVNHDWLEETAREVA
jgi:transposase